MAVNAQTELVKIPYTSAHVLLRPKVRPTIISALAGVGNPMNDDDCRSSRLKIPNRNDEKAAITNGIRRSQWPFRRPSFFGSSRLCRISS